MNISRSKKGSALLIVLGMVAFMVVSAVGFATYMRLARAPSSFLRRTSATRLLVKAAMAEAIAKIDEAIYNNPHPNVGNAQSGDSNGLQDRRSDAASNPNTWADRTFIGQSDQLPSQISEAFTVSPLCVEALAYVPTPLVNSFRWFSRHTQCATWQPLGFDSGRYVWAALDVSDYFDVNKMLADHRRTSGSNTRITLAHVFEEGEGDEDEHSSSGENAKTWDDFMKKFRGDFDEDTGQFKDINGSYPFVSIADFNLALGRNGGIGDINSTFYRYFSGEGDARNSQPGSTGNDSIDYGWLPRMTFVTDGLQTPDTIGNDAINLSDPQDQPFNAEKLKSGASVSLAEAMGMTGDLINRNRHKWWLDKLSGLGIAQLYDYLDEDNIPASLAIPTTERTAMVCGISPATGGSGKLRITRKITEEPDNTDPNATTRNMKMTVSFCIEKEDFAAAFKSFTFNVMTVYPFSHVLDEDKANFEISGGYSMFFSTEQMKLRTSKDDVLHFQNGKFRESGLNTETGVFSSELEPNSRSVIFNKPIAKESDRENALKSTMMTMTRGAAAWQEKLGETTPLITLTYEWTQTRSKSATGSMGDWVPTRSQAVADPANLKEAFCGIRPLTEAGVTDPEFSGADSFLAKMQSGYNGTWRLNGAIWIQIKNADGDVVDMVPACQEDDVAMKGYKASTGYEEITRTVCGNPYPLLRFNCAELNINMNDWINDEIDNNEKEVESAELNVAFAGAKPGDSLIVADPRFNYAPEHWFSVSGNLDANKWLSECRFLNDGKDGDMFMSTSDSCYLQSKYELAFLPAITLLADGGGFAGLMRRPDVETRNDLPTGFDDVVNRDFMWKTYDPFDTHRSAFDDMDVVTSGNGVKVNPYSDDINVMMAAFANTPLEWRLASTNTTTAFAQKFKDMKSKDFNENYAWNAYGADDGRISWRDLKRVATSFMARMQTCSKLWDEGNNCEAWVTEWNSLPWDDRTTSRLIGLTFEDDHSAFWSVDKKFLYGFWRDSFAAKQQLFLVFVRAEPMMMGGDGTIPPQLGARAMAVVWRDPREPEDSTSPHQMRILFYRQFE